MSTKKRYFLTPEQAYELMNAALVVATSPSKSTYRRVMRAVKNREGTSSTLISPRAYAQLAQVLEEIHPGILDASWEEQ